MNCIVSPNKEYEWNVLQTHSNLERKVERNLSLLGINTLLPLKSTIRQWKDRKKMIKVPLFPNYIFVLTNKETRYKALDIKGVYGFIKFSGKRSVVSEKEIDIISKISQLPDVEIEFPFKNGEKVEIINGPFCGLTGNVFEKRGKNRLIIKIYSLNNFISVEIASSDIRRCQKCEIQNITTGA